MINLKNYKITTTKKFFGEDHIEFIKTDKKNKCIVIASEKF